MKNIFTKILILIIVGAWTMLCIFGFLTAYFAGRDTLACLAVLIWFAMGFIFADDIGKRFK